MGYEKNVMAAALTVGLVSDCGAGTGDQEGSDAFADQDADEPGLVSASGYVFFCGPSGGRVDGATATVLEFPGWETVTREDGEWSFADLRGDARVSFVMTHEASPSSRRAPFI